MLRLVGQIISVVLGLLWAAFLVLAPLTAAWAASSLVAFHGGPRGLALAAALLVFPILPVVWELRASAKWRANVARKKQFVGKPKRALSTFDRLVLRTLTITALFLGVLLASAPKTAFEALSTRGDWFIADRHEPWANTVRHVAFTSAGALEWLHEAANPNPYKKPGDDVLPTPAPTASDEPLPHQPIARRWVPGTGPWRHADAGAADDETMDVELHVGTSPDAGTKVVAATEDREAPADALRVGDTYWPYPSTVHPAVASLRPEDETSIENVARALREREPDSFQRVKALHDWVVTRLHYDFDSLKPGQRKAQDAHTVFTNRMGVCEGYARLLVELGKHSGDRIVFLVGEARGDDGEGLVGHAWNAVEIEHRWYLIDATWDDPSAPGSANDEHYRTDYLFVPPTVAILDHLPETPKWQLLEHEVSRGDFLRTPFAGAGLAREHLTMREPARSEVDVEGELQVELDNPLRRYVMVTLASEHGQGTECGVSNDERVRLECKLPSDGRYIAHVFTSPVHYGTYDSVASIRVTGR